MKTSTLFYNDFMKLANRINNAKSKAKVAKIAGSNLQPLAEYFDDDGLDTMDHDGVEDGYMFDTTFPLWNPKHKKLHKYYLYSYDIIRKPIKSYIGKTLVSTSHKTFTTAKLATKSDVFDVMADLYDMGATDTDNRHNPDEEGGFWGDRSGLTAKQEYDMQKAIGIKVSKNFINGENNYRKTALADHKKDLKNKIKSFKTKQDKYKKQLSDLNK